MENDIVELLSELVRINSVNSTLSHGPGESEIAKFIRFRLDQLELHSEILTTTTDRSNVIAVVPGRCRYTLSHEVSFSHIFNINL